MLRFDVVIFFPSRTKFVKIKDSMQQTIRRERDAVARVRTYMDYRVAIPIYLWSFELFGEQNIIMIERKACAFLFS